jgi:PHD/YefM family antitoxin component YafN of YafNO toxin-antitoxin module
MSDHTSRSPRVVKSVPLARVRDRPEQVIGGVVAGREYLILRQDGLPVVGMMGIEEFEDYLELQDPAVKRHLAASKAERRRGKTHPAENLLAALQSADSPGKRTARRASARNGV